MLPLVPKAHLSPWISINTRDRKCRQLSWMQARPRVWGQGALFVVCVESSKMKVRGKDKHRQTWGCSGKLHIFMCREPDKLGGIKLGPHLENLSTMWRIDGIRQKVKQKAERTASGGWNNVQ